MPSRMWDEITYPCCDLNWPMLVKRTHGHQDYVTTDVCNGITLDDCFMPDREITCRCSNQYCNIDPLYMCIGKYIDGLVQDCSNPIANALEFYQSAIGGHVTIPLSINICIMWILVRKVIDRLASSHTVAVFARDVLVYDTKGGMGLKQSNMALKIFAELAHGSIFFTSRRNIVRVLHISYETDNAMAKIMSI